MLLRIHVLLICFLFSSTSKSQESQEYYLDTTNDISGGNWFLKKEIATKARVLYEKLQKSVASLKQTQAYFIDARISLTTVFDTFYKDLEMQPDQLMALVTKTLETIDTERKKKDDAAERDSFIELTAQYQELELFLKNIELIPQANKNIDAAVKSSMDILVTADEYIDKAWKHVLEIDTILDHERAQQLYAQIESYLETVEQLDTAYLGGKLKEYIEATAETMKSQMTKVTAMLHELREKNILPKKEEPKEAIVTIPAPVAPEPLGWFATIMHYVLTPFRWISNFFHYIYTLIKALFS